LNFFIDFTRPELLSLQSDLEKSDFKIERFGRVNFTAVNAPFLYTAYEKDQALRSFMVGPENPNFRSLEQIPPFLKNAVLISEDGAFFGHKGFLLEPFKESIAANIKGKRFIRGASTISMQLVKNLYLKRQKTIARKLEEMLITWLIEEKHLVAKERMYEIYLNIIEWGPLVYGAQEAARFYFDKDVAELTLAEAIFMASIIPRPKRFMVSFDQDLHLRPWLKAYYSDVSYKMLKREMISQQDYDLLVPDIQLKGPARFLLKGNENMLDDQLWQPEEIEE
jgi:membrane peptidoglycan carboxypeptidase